MRRFAGDGTEMSLYLRVIGEALGIGGIEADNSPIFRDGTGT